MVEADAAGILETLAAWPELPNASEVPGFAVGVSWQGSRAERGFGVVRLGSNTAVTPSTAFGICSVSKPFTATLAMTLVESGDLELDRPVVELLPGFRLSSAEATEMLTLRHLLTHTGGFACEFGSDLSVLGSDDLAIERVIPHYASLSQWARPGGEWGYCNAGFWLIAALVARVTGEPFERQMELRVLDPLGLDRTGYAGLRRSHGKAGGTSGLGDAATPHPALDEGGRVVPNTGLMMPRARNASGGLHSTVGDLLQFAEVHIGAQETSILAADLMRSMQIPSASIGIRDRWQGLGWEIDGEGADRQVWHDGSYGGFESMLVMVPARSFAFAVLTNSDLGRRTCQRIRSMILRSVFAIEDAVPARAAFSADLSAFAGRYDLGSDTVVVDVEANALTVRHAGGSGGACRFVPLEDGTFLMAGGDPQDRLSFPRRDGEQVALIRLDGRLGRRC